MADDAVDARDGFFFAGHKDSSKSRFHCVGFSFLQKDARGALTQSAKHLIADGFRLGGNFIGADVFILLFSQQNHFIANFAVGNMRNIQRAHVHRYPPDDRRAPAANEGLALIGKDKGVTVAVSHRNGRHTGFVFGDKGSVVADAVAFRELLHENNRCFKRHDRRECRFAFGFVRGINAVRHDAGTRHFQF